jgi:hypothetical protein
MGDGVRTLVAEVVPNAANPWDDVSQNTLPFRVGLLADLAFLEGGIAYAEDALYNPRLDVVIQNQGVSASDTTTVRVYEGSPLMGEGRLIRDLLVPPLEPGETIRLSSTACLHAGHQEVYVRINEDHALSELDTSNNVAMVSVYASGESCQWAHVPFVVGRRP